MAKNGTVLLIDRDSDLVAILGSFLTSNGYRMVATTRVREALRKLGNQQFVHVFMDPALAPDHSAKILDDLSTPGTLNFKTPFTIMAKDLEHAIPYDFTKRLHAIIAKPFQLSEFALRLETAREKA